MNNNTILKKIRRTANVGLYGSITVIILTIIFHYCPYEIRQTDQVMKWMLIAGTIMAVLTVVMMLLTIRKTGPQLRSLSSVEEKLKGYSSYISNLYTSTFSVIIIECVLIALMADTSLLMVIILMVLILFLSYPNMYKMKHDIALTDEDMKALYPDDYIADPQPADAEPDIELADAQLTKDEEERNSNRE